MSGPTIGEVLEDLQAEVCRLMPVVNAAKALRDHFKRDGIYAMDRDTRCYMADLEQALDAVEHHP